MLEYTDFIKAFFTFKMYGCTVTANKYNFIYDHKKSMACLGRFLQNSQMSVALFADVLERTVTCGQKIA